MSDDIDLEEEIRLELERLEQIFCEETGNTLNDESTVRMKPNRVSYSAYEYAEAEGEKEELEDKLNLLLSKTEDFSVQMERMNQLNADLQNRCTQLQIENARMKEKMEKSCVEGGEHYVNKSMYSEVKDGAYFSVSELEKQQVCSAIGPSTSLALEHLLVEERSKVTQLEAALRDMMLIKDSALLELERERGLRIHAEKERDAYSAAYEASLQHFEKWTKSKSKS